MKKRRRGKILALGGVFALCLSLSSCYIPPDDLSGELNNPGLNGNTFNPVTLTTAPPTAAPTDVPAGNFPVVTGQTGQAPSIDWDGWGTNPFVSNAPGTSVNPGISVTNSVTSQAPISTSGIRPGVVATNTPRPSATPAPTSLKNGSSGSAVKSLQSRLKELGYYTGSVDGDFGDQTESAVRAFQRASGLTVDGKAGTQTLTKLNSSTAPTAAPKATAKPTAKATAKATARPTARPTQRATARPTNTPRPTASPTPRPTATPDLSHDIYLRDGSSSKDVKRLQERLISLGWLVGEANTEFGGATEAAVIAFQKKTSGLWDDGVAGPDTLRALYSENAARSSSPVASVGIKLELGDEGDAVRALQKRLRALGYMNDSADGTYGEKTRAAVIAFQSSMGLHVDGIAGTSTLTVLYRSSTPKAGDVAANGESHSPTGGSGYATLQEGDKSDAVLDLQQALRNHGFFSGTVSGTYGSATESAVRAFQKAYGFRVTGKAGAATQRAIFGTNTTVSYGTLRPGDEGDGVLDIQYTLYELGYYDGQMDGIYSSLLSDAVRAFQMNNDLTVDGKAGKDTLKKLYSFTARAAGAAATSFETLRRGDDGSAVLELQNALMNLGYLSEMTGLYDDATYDAVKRFQERNGLTADGVAGNETQTKLYSDSAVRAR